MEIISIKQNPEYKDQAVKYFQSKWATEQSLMVYEELYFKLYYRIKSASTMVFANGKRKYYRLRRTCN